MDYEETAHRLMQKDICQTVFMKYLSGNIVFQTKTHEKAWMIRTTINACHDLRKNAFFKRTVSLDDAAEAVAPDMPSSDLLDEIKKLPVNYRISIYLHYYEGYSVKEIAALMNKKESAVSKYLSRGKQQLRNSLTRDNDELCKAGEFYGA